MGLASGSTGGSTVGHQHPQDEEFSTLEVTSPTHREVAENMREGSAQVFEKRVNEHNGAMEVVGAPSVARNRDGLYDGKQVVKQKRHEGRKVCGMSRRTSLIMLAIVLLVIIAAAVGAGVGVTRSNSKTAEKASPPVASNPPGGSKTKGPPAVPLNSALSAISWNQSGTTYRRLFYQHGTTNGIMMSTWDSVSNSFKSTTVTNSSISVKKGSPIIGTLLTHNMWVNHIAFIDSQNNFRSIWTRDPTGQSWVVDDNSVEALDISPQSTLANYWLVCTGPGCWDNWVLVYQNSDGTLRVRNGTWHGAFRYKLDITPPLGSKMSLAQCGQDPTLLLFWTLDTATETQVYGYQWSSQLETPNNWANVSSAPLASIPLGAQISAFATSGCASNGVLFTPADSTSGSGIGQVTCGPTHSCQTQPLLSATVQPQFQGNTVLNRSTIAVANDTVYVLASQDNKTVIVDGWTGIPGSTWNALPDVDTDGL